jgi:DNA-binding NtrC family response regulator
MLLDVRLPDGDAFTVLEHAIQTTPGTMRIALSGAASSDDGFRLGQFGVREFLQKPASLDDIWDAIQRAAEEPPDLKPHVQQAVGYGSLRELLAMVRAEAIKYALLISRGNRTDAARILQVTRQAVQQMLRPAKR